MPNPRNPAAAKGKQSKKLFTFKPRSNAGSSSGNAKKPAARKQKALFKVERHIRKKEPDAGTATNTVMLYVRPADGANDQLRERLQPKLLGEVLRWNRDENAFGARIYTKKQAADCLAEMRTLLGPNADDVPATVSDEPWSAGTNAMVDVVPCLRVYEGEPEPVGVQFSDAVASTTTEEVILLDGVTYPLKEQLKEMGFKWVVDFNGMDGANHWVRPAFGFDINTVVGLFDQWGWIVNVFDGVDDDK